MMFMSCTISVFRRDEGFTWKKQVMVNETCSHLYFFVIPALVDVLLPEKKKKGISLKNA